MVMPKAGEYISWAESCTDNRESSQDLIIIHIHNNTCKPTLLF